MKTIFEKCPKHLLFAYVLFFYMVSVSSSALAQTVLKTSTDPTATASTTEVPYYFSSNLKVGSRGADVVALQSFLENKGLLTMPSGVPKGYYGPRTKRGVFLYKKMRGIHTVGEFGPITRTAVMADILASLSEVGTKQVLTEQLSMEFMKEIDAFNPVEEITIEDKLFQTPPTDIPIVSVDTEHQTSRLHVTESLVPLDPKNFSIDPNDGAKRVPLITFDVKSEDGSSNIEELSIGMHAAQLIQPTTLYLFSSDNLIATQSVPRIQNNNLSVSTVSFSNLSFMVEKDTTTALKVLADFPSNTPSGSLVSLLKGIKYKNRGGVITSISSCIKPTENYFYPKAVNFSLFGMPNISKVTDDQANTVSISTSFNILVEGLQASFRKPKADDFEVEAYGLDSEASIPVTPSITFTEKAGRDRDSTTLVTVAVTLTKSQVLQSKLYGFRIVKIKWGSNNSTWAHQTWGLSQFKTPTLSCFVMPKNVTSNIDPSPLPVAPMRAIEHVEEIRPRALGRRSKLVVSSSGNRK